MVSGVLYKQLDCEALNDQIIFLEGRFEKELVMLQEYRISESTSQQLLGKWKWNREMVWKLQNCIKLEERLLLRVKNVFQNKGCM